MLASYKLEAFYRLVVVDLWWEVIFAWIQCFVDANMCCLKVFPFGICAFSASNHMNTRLAHSLCMIFLMNLNKKNPAGNEALPDNKPNKLFMKNILPKENAFN